VDKTHVASALSRAMLKLGKRLKFSPGTALVQLLQQAKLQLQLQPLLVKLDRFDLIVIDDLDYVKKTEAETSVIFELISHRPERQSMIVQPISLSASGIASSLTR
jgi:DNA replication protein DnaC